ncbi:MAG: imelysin family protein [Rhizobiaceae bacterium]
MKALSFSSRRVAAAWLAALLMASPTVPARAENLDRFAGIAMKAALEDFVRPAYRHLSDEAATLVDDAETMCATPSPETLERTRAGYDELVRAWAGAEMVRFGPVLVDHVLERFLFYPDRRGRGLRQVQAILAEKDDTAVDAGVLAGKSVAVQGLGALDFILFGTGSDALAGEPESFRCRYAQAVAANLHTMAAGLDGEWRGDGEFLAFWLEPGADNPVFVDGYEAVSHLLSTVVHGLETVRETRLAAFLKATPEEDRPRSALLWRSGVTLSMLRADVEAMGRLFDAARLADALPEAERGAIVDDIHARFADLSELMALDGRIDDLLADADSRAQLVAIDGAMQDLIAVFYERYAKTIGLRVGFFFDDGD